MKDSQINKMYKVAVYTDVEGREVHELTNIADATDLKYAVLFPMPTPMGMDKVRLFLGDAKNVADAFNKHDAAISQMVDKIQKEMSKPKLQIAK